MEGSISLRAHERKTLLQVYKTGSTHEQRLRAHLLLLLADGISWLTIASMLFTSSSTINRWRQRFLADGLEAVIHASCRRGPSRLSMLWIGVIFRWVTMQTPRDFGFVRSRWTCGTIVALLEEDHGVKVGRETVRRWLHQKDLVYRRPRPVLGPRDPKRPYKLRTIRSLLKHLPDNEIAVFQDEVDVNTNPKIGLMWMPRGHQATVETPGNNTKRYLAGSLNWRTGELILTEGTKRNADLFLAHLDELRRRYRRYRVIHVICDNAVFHSSERCRKVVAYLKTWGHRVKLHYLPTYSPDTNPIERVWWHLHEEITRNHRCKNIEELLDLVFEWLNAGSSFQFETSIYDFAVAA
jgi:putative transposase